MAGLRLRQRAAWCVVAVLSVLLGGLSLPARAPAGPAVEGTWKAGVARAKITPQRPLWLAGYSSRVRPAEGKMHDLWVKVLVLEAPGGGRGVIVAADLLGFPKGVADAICADLQQGCGLARDQIMLTCSHTHCGPVLQDALYDVYPLDRQQRALIAEYTGELIKTVVRTVGEALGHTAPATLWTGEGRTEFAVNRRNNPDKLVPQMRKEGKPLLGPVDHRVPVLAVRAADGRLLAAVFLYACHNTTLDFYQWSGDYAGVAQIAVEAKHPRAQAMFLIGCGADQNPLPRRTVALCEKYGRMLSGAVETVLERPMRPLPPRLATRFAILPLGFEGSLDRASLEADAVRSDYIGRYARRMLPLVCSGRPLPASYPYPVQAWRLGAEQWWIALGGEVVVEYAAALRARFGPSTWAIGYANDVMAYIPSTRVWKEGGYEAGAFNVYGLPARRWTADIQQQIINAAGRLVESTPSRQPAASSQP
jgi:hypothetical protein